MIIKAVTLQILTIEIQDPVGMSSALDTELTVTSGPIPWFIQTEVTYDGVDAAQSGEVDDGADEVGKLMFWWPDGEYLNDGAMLLDHTNENCVCVCVNACGDDELVDAGDGGNDD